MAGICLPPVIQQKPTFGEPCNGCGFCCAAEVCGIGKQVHGDIEGPCPSMTYQEGRFFCGVVLIEELAGMEPLIRQALGIGRGCDADDRC